MANETASNAPGPALHEYEPLILVTRGDELPKKNYERKLHPTYEVRGHTSPHFHQTDRITNLLGNQRMHTFTLHRTDIHSHQERRSADLSPLRCQILRPVQGPVRRTESTGCRRRPCNQHWCVVSAEVSQVVRWVHSDRAAIAAQVHRNSTTFHPFFLLLFRSPDHFSFSFYRCSSSDATCWTSGWGPSSLTTTPSPPRPRYKMLLFDGEECL